MKHDLLCSSHHPVTFETTLDTLILMREDQDKVLHDRIKCNLFRWKACVLSIVNKILSSIQLHKYSHSLWMTSKYTSIYIKK